MSVKNDNERPDHFTREINYDQLVVGKRYKLIFPDGSVRIGTHIEEPLPRMKSFSVFNPRRGLNQTLTHSKGLGVRYFAKEFDGGARRRKSRRNKRRAIRRKSRRNNSA